MIPRRSGLLIAAALAMAAAPLPSAPRRNINREPRQPDPAELDRRRAEWADNLAKADAKRARKAAKRAREAGF